ncbi:BLUF domain-containing protein [Hymenobacter sp. H14-R3]|uniref:BLUF domain-containing protein n=1 Tax=Hymenobacter sp. H14-R3 TaxID=3046308 RepID=UPI0024BAABC9|nr:BLUF domain-containing protein [Hymenobacter sp. H14-R3]MDJ0364110.1 BLUF domain-containing protein [Hymenobacter sp. H14-R3]
MNNLSPDLAHQQLALEWAIALATGPETGIAEGLPAYLPPPPEQPELPQEPGVYHLLYCSQAVHVFGEEQLADLLEHALARNAQCDITGLLCYGNGHFVQVLEGEAAAVEKLFTRILCDRRHHRLHVLSRGVGPARRFDDWRMAFAKNQTHEFYWLITFLEAHHHHLLLRQVPIAEPTFTGALEEFSNTCPDS